MESFKGKLIDHVRTFLEEEKFIGSVHDLADDDSLLIYERFRSTLEFEDQQGSVDWLRFEELYSREHVDAQHGILVIFGDQFRIDAIWVLTLSQVDGKFGFGTSTLPLYPPLLSASISTRRSKEITRACINLGYRLATQFGMNGWSSREYGPIGHGLSQWHAESRNLGATTQLESHLYLDLTLHIETIRASIRQSYKSLIKSGLQKITPTVFVGESRSEWDEFRQLHLYVSGRTTRSIETWNLQFDLMREGRAFSVYIRDSAEILIGAIYVHHTKDEALYVSGVFDRDHKSTPLGHIAHWIAIQELQKRKVRWYCLGERPYANTIPAPSPKDVSIAYFKEGFATDKFPHITYMFPTGPLLK